MRDLKHLIYFENLLQQANNDLVQAACRDGRLALAWNCSYIPEVLLDTDKCFGVHSVLRSGISRYVQKNFSFGISSQYSKYCSIRFIVVQHSCPMSAEIKL